jgi:hypothetical protein
MTLQISSDNICRINNKKCQDNKCCSINNQCGEGFDYCNKNDVYNGENAINKHNILLNNEIKYIYDNNNNILLSKNGRCGIDLKNKTQVQCNNELYCNNFSFCDESNDNVLQLNINNIPATTQKYDGSNTFRDVHKDKNVEVSSDGKCGLKNKNKICPEGECCSKEGECGTSKDHCYMSQAEKYASRINLNNIGFVNTDYFSGKGAIEKYEKKTDEKLQNMYDTDNIVLTNNGICGFNKDDDKIYKCLPEQCCSKNNVCSINLDHCDLDNEKLIKLNGIKSIEKYINDKNEKNKIYNESIGFKYNNNDFCGKDPKTDQIFNCDTNNCCYNNKCGSGFDFCEFADPNNKYHGNNALENYKKNRISTDGTCNDKICTDGECCSNTYKCGKGDSYCNNTNSKFNGFKSLQYKYDKNNFVTDSSLNICGNKDNQIYRCNPGYCCLKNGTCTLDCSNSLVNIYDNDISENITFYINDNSEILQLRINELKATNSTFLNLTVKKSKINYAIRHSNKTKYYNDEIFELINELLNKEYTRNKLNGDGAVNNYINNKILNTYKNSKTKSSKTNNCYVDYTNNVKYRCPPHTYCNYKNNACNVCDDKTNKTINGKILKKLDGERYDLLIFILFLILLSFLVYYFINKV